MGNGLLFSYFALSGWWTQWKFLWPLEPLMVGFSIIAPFLLRRQEARGEWLARRVGIVLVVLAVAVIVFSLLVGIVIP